MKTSFCSALSLSLLTFTGAALMSGCSGSSSPADAGDAATTSDATTTGDAPAGDGPVLFGLSLGDSCFDIVSIAPGFSDDCMIGVADPASSGGPIGATKLVHYDMPTATLTVGTAGSLGDGIIMNNMGTLLRDADTSDTTMTSCTWHQKDTSMVTLTATNQFSISVTEVESMFAAAPACTAGSTPPSGTCTSTWTWTMQKNPNKSPTTTPPCM